MATFNKKASLATIIFILFLMAGILVFGKYLSGYAAFQVSQDQQCTGTPVLTLNATSASPDVRMQANVSNLSNCQNINASLWQWYEGGTYYINSTNCLNTYCIMNFQVPTSFGKYNYSAWVDKNQNKFPDLGEISNNATLIIAQAPVSQISPNETYVNTETTFGAEISSDVERCWFYWDGKNISEMRYASIPPGKASALIEYTPQSFGTHKAYANCTNGTHWFYNETNILVKCNGIINCELIPETVDRNGVVMANVTMSEGNCSGLKVELKKGDNCLTSSIGAANINDNNTASIRFTAPSSIGSYNYTICADLTLNGTYDSGEFITKTLKVIPCVYSNPGISAYPKEHDTQAGNVVFYKIEIENKDNCVSKFNLNTSCVENFDCKFYPSSLTLHEKEKGTSVLAIKSNETISNIQYVTVTANVSNNANSSFWNSTQVNYILVAACENKSPRVALSPENLTIFVRSNKNASIEIFNEDASCSNSYNVSVECPDGVECVLYPSNLLSVGKRGAESIDLLLNASEEAVAGDYEIKIQVKDVNTNFTTNVTLPVTIISECSDEDKDNYSPEGGPCGEIDCDDTNPNVHPGAIAYCISEIDANCNNITDKLESGCNKSAPLEDQILPKWKAGDGKCDTWAGENSSNSPADCAPQTPTQKCGNNKRETGEDCDGTDDAACPGLCTETCKCPFMIGDGICSEAAGETSAISTDCKKPSLLPIILIVIIVSLAGVLGAIFFMRKKTLENLSEVHGVSTYEPGKDLGPAVDNMLAEGFSPSEISKHLSSGGWPQNSINKVFANASATQTELFKLAEEHNVHVPSTELRSLKRYVKKCLDLGYTPTQIKTALLSADWPEYAVDDVLSDYTSKHIKEHAKKKKVLKPTADLDELKKYVKEELDEGHTPEQIKEELLKAGWEEDKIKEVLP